MTPLHVAAANARATAVKCLIKAGADINTRNNVGSTPLHEAAEAGDKVLRTAPHLCLSPFSECHRSSSRMHFFRPSTPVACCWRQALCPTWQTVSATLPCTVQHGTGTLMWRSSCSVCLAAFLKERRAIVSCTALMASTHVIFNPQGFNADRGIRSKSGKLAIDLANKAGHRGVAQLLANPPRCAQE